MSSEKNRRRQPAAQAINNEYYSKVYGIIKATEDGEKSSFSTKLCRGFGRMPSAPINLGYVRFMKPSDMALYMSLCSHVNPEGKCWVSMDRLGMLTGRSRSALSLSVKRLQDLGLIQVEYGTGRGRANTYTIIQPTSPPPVAAKSALIHAQKAPNSDSQSAQNGDAKRPRDCTPTENQQNETEQQQNRPTCKSSAAATVLNSSIHKSQGFANQALRRVLERFGIGEPKLSELAARSGLTLSLIFEEIEKARERGKGPGALVRNLEARADAVEAASKNEKAWDNLSADQKNGLCRRILDRYPNLVGQPEDRIMQYAKIDHCKNNPQNAA
ncbi:MAG: hypothetical protein GC164_01975 [Phycisphaera sp.]|nr:hypothetical protein [Phycisphaera sp.]